jgi:hypothetical protein
MLVPFGTHVLVYSVTVVVRFAGDAGSNDLSRLVADRGTAVLKTITKGAGQ